MSLASLIALVSQAEDPRLSWGTAVVGETATLAPQEAALVAHARPRRRAEFIAGRLAARRALMAIGQAHAPIAATEDRLPVWPNGFVGSISHSAGLAVAVLAGAKHFQSVGVDLEPDQPVDAELIEEICRPEEPHDAARRVFSAKEAVYKAQYPATRVIFGFHGMAVDMAKGRANYAAHPETATIPPEWRDRDLPFSQWYDGTLILSLSTLPA